MPAADVVILGAARTPIGRYGGASRDLHPAGLGAVAARAAFERAGIAPGDIDEVLIGHGRQTGSGPNPARQVGHRTGIPNAAPAQTINNASGITDGGAALILASADAARARGLTPRAKILWASAGVDRRLKGSGGMGMAIAVERIAQCG
jgi:acetyl-CoA C-acetyltransferase